MDLLRDQTEGQRSHSELLTEEGHPVGATGSSTIRVHACVCVCVCVCV